MQKSGFGADNQGLYPALASVFFDRKDARNPHLIIHANRYAAKLKKKPRENYLDDNYQFDTN